jgi:acyl carrier protein
MSTDPNQPVPVSLSPTERAVAALWCEALQMTDLPSPPDNFFALGGDSMTMTILEFRIKEELAVELPAGALLNAASLRELSALVDATRDVTRRDIS